MSHLLDQIIDLNNLRREFKHIKPDAAPGDDGVTKADYEANLEANIADLSACLRTGKYEPGPITLTSVPKADGSRRPVSIMRVEDKLAQRAVLTPVGEKLREVFCDYSFAVTGLGQRAACDQVYVALFEKSYRHWVKLDVANCYGSVRQHALQEMVLHHLGDEPDVVSLLWRMMRPTVVDRDGREEPASVVGIAQGMPLSMLFANLYLHYAADLPLVEQAADGLVVVRYLDDILLGAETDQLLGEARERVQDGLRRYGMSLKEAKTGEYLLESDGDAFTFLGTRFERTSLENGHAYRTLPAPRRTSRHK